jgi:hypothetical protein
MQNQPPAQEDTDANHDDSNTKPRNANGKVIDCCRNDYQGLKYHMMDAYQEANRDIDDTCVNNPPFALFSRKYWSDIRQLDHTKKHDFCFIGSMDTKLGYRGNWVVEFAQKYFTKDSVFINTYNPTHWTSLGDFDYTMSNLGFNPASQIDNQSRQVQYRIVHENLFYFETMCQSKYVLCPGGDSPWSFRFYETLMCQAVPIVETWHHTYRTPEESLLPYEYILYDDESKISDTSLDVTSMVTKNTEIFEANHVLPRSE